MQILTHVSGRPARKMMLTSTIDGEQMTFNNINDAAAFLKCRPQSIRNAIACNRLILGCKAEFLPGGAQ